MKRFRVTIEEIETTSKKHQDNWQVIDRIEEQRDDEFMAKYPNESPVRTKDVYGHPPAIDKESTEIKKVYEQQVDSLDIKQVIEAVNKLQE